MPPSDVPHLALSLPWPQAPGQLEMIPVPASLHCSLRTPGSSGVMEMPRVPGLEGTGWRVGSQRPEGAVGASLPGQPLS